jgi:hypothetical protein
MKIVARAMLGVAITGVFGFVGLMSNPAFANDLGLDFFGLNSIEQQMANANLMNRHLDSCQEIVSRRMTARNVVLHDIVEGRMTFDEGAQMFLELDAHEPLIMDIVRSHFPGDTDLERARQQVLRYMRVDVNEHVREFGKKYEAEMMAKVASAK